MKRLVRRLSALAGLRRKWMLVPALVALALLVTGGLWFMGHAGANSIWNQPSVPISDVLDRVDRGEILGASISGQRILLTDVPPDYIEVNLTKMTAKLTRIPHLNEVPYPVQMEPHLVVEFYSR